MSAKAQTDLASNLPQQQRTVVILLHGIRTRAWWQTRVASIIREKTGATVIPLKFGYFDTLRFLCPFRICRSGPIRRIERQLQGIRDEYSGSRLIVFAHSFGTFILAQVLLHNARFKFNRIILCGSIISNSFDWDRVQDQILFTGDKRDAIINECGIFDVWPVLASSCTWGYGATGTYGFGVYNVRDRFHEFRHSDFFNTDFILSNWVPAVQGLPIDFSKTDTAPEGLEPKLFSYLRFPLRWIIVGLFPIIAVGASLLFWNPKCPTDTVRMGRSCVTVAAPSIAAVNERIGKLLVEVRRELSAKSNLLRLLESYQQNPNVQSPYGQWERIRQEASRLQSSTQEALQSINEYNAHIWSVGDKAKFVTADGKTVTIDQKYWNLFKDIETQFEKKEDVLSVMSRTTEPPDRSQVAKWHDELTFLLNQLNNVGQAIVDGLPSADGR